MTSRDRAQHHWRIAFFVWGTFLTIATHLPQGEISDQPLVESPDKLLHMICFGMLAFLFMCCGWIKNKWVVWITVALWAVIDEATQHAMPIGREFSLHDLVAGEIGIVCAIVWMGSLHTPVTTKIHDAIELALARANHWFALGAIAAVATIVPNVVLWFVFSLTISMQLNGLAMFVGILVATASVLYGLVKIGSIESEIKHLRKNMAMTLYGTIAIATMVGFSISHTFFDPWVAALACLVVGSRIAWNHAINLQIESQNE
jgi:VanZ family protein